MRTKARTLVTLATVTIMLPACSRGRSESEEKRPTETSAEVPQHVESGQGHADASVTPGLYAHWCEEHGVPETMCTRRKADIVAACKTPGDWCEEHGLPESHCRQRNPKLTIVRPPKPEEM